MRNRLAMAVLLSAALWGCSKGDGNNEITDAPDQDGGDNVPPTDEDVSCTTAPWPASCVTWAVKDVEVFTPDRGGGIEGKLLRDPADGTLYYAYLKYDGELNTLGINCNIAVFGGGPKPTSVYRLRVARLAPGATQWVAEQVPLENVPATNNVAAIGARLGIDGTFNSAGDLVLAFAGGGPGLFTCSSSDLVLATRGRANGQWSFSVPVDLSAACCSVADCNNDPACTSGRDVGVWASVDRRGDGVLGAVYTDLHNATDQDGQTKQGLEIWENGTVTGVQPWSGKGNFAALRYANTTPIVAYTGYSGGGLFVRRRTGTTGHVADWQAPTGVAGGDLRSGAKIGERISLAVAPDGTTIGIAAYEEADGGDNAKGDLVYCQSIDGGATWQIPCLGIDTLGTVGQYPSLAFDAANQPVISYYYCGAAGDCTAAADGLRIAWRDNARNTWVKYNVYFDSGTKSGQYTSLVIDPTTGTPMVAFHDLTRGAAMVARAQVQGVTP